MRLRGTVRQPRKNLKRLLFLVMMIQMHERFSEYA